MKHLRSRQGRPKHGVGPSVKQKTQKLYLAGTFFIMAYIVYGPTILGPTTVFHCSNTQIKCHVCTCDRDGSGSAPRCVRLLQVLPNQSSVRSESIFHRTGMCRHRNASCFSCHVASYGFTFRRKSAFNANAHTLVLLQITIPVCDSE